MDTFAQILQGFSVALEPINLLYCLVGVIFGTVIGVLPGLGPTATIALLLPITYAVPAEAAIIMLAGIYYGAMYGGSTTSILLDLPGEAASVVTCMDGYQMAKNGRAGAALGISAIGSFIAGTIALLGLSLVAPPLAAIAIRFGPPEFFAIAVLGLMLVGSLSGGSAVKGMISAAGGLLLACIGQDPVHGSLRYNFGIIELSGGLEFAALAMGLFGVAEIIYNFEGSEEGQLVTTKLDHLWPTLKDWAEAKWAIIRGSLIGFFVGILPGGGAVISSLLSYSIEKKMSKDPSRFGKGAIEGVAGPESANNAAAGSAFIPLMTLGIPANSVMAMMYAALLMHGVQPGPFMLEEHPQLFWGIIDSMYIGNILLLILNLPLVGLFVQLLKVRYSILAPIAILISLVGVYSINNSVFEIWVILVFGVVGYFMRKFRYDAGPMVLAFVLGPIMEKSFRQSLLMSNGSFEVFFDRPISLGIIAMIVLFAVFQVYRSMKSKRQTISVPSN
jgi:putative tricarboxylic transport membrane protein